MLFFLFFFLKPINKSILAKEGIKEKTLLNWHKAIAHITRCTQAAVYFLIKVFSTSSKAEHWSSVLSLEKGVLGSSYKEKVRRSLSLLILIFSPFLFLSVPIHGYHSFLSQ